MSEVCIWVEFNANTQPLEKILTSFSMMPSFLPIITTSSGVDFNFYTRIPRATPGLKTLGYIANLLDETGWKRLGEDIAKIIAITNKKVFVLEMESSVLPFTNGVEVVDLKKLKRILDAFLPKNIIYYLWPGVQSDVVETFNRQLALMKTFDSVRDCVGIGRSLGTYGDLTRHGRLKGMSIMKKEMRSSPSSIVYLYDFAPWWRFVDAIVPIFWAKDTMPYVIIYPGQENFINKPKELKEAIDKALNL